MSVQGVSSIPNTSSKPQKKKIFTPGAVTGVITGSLLSANFIYRSEKNGNLKDIIADMPKKKANLTKLKRYSVLAGILIGVGILAGSIADYFSNKNNQK